MSRFGFIIFEHAQLPIFKYAHFFYYLDIDLILYSIYFRSAFFFFCGDERGKIKAAHPSWTVADIAKDLGKRWEGVTDRSQYEKRAQEDKKRYAAVSTMSPDNRP